MSIDPTNNLLIVHRGQQVSAIYRQPELSEFYGNPLIEALPPVISDKQASSILSYYPNYNKSDRSFPNHNRYLHIQNGLRFFAPLDVHIDLQRRFSCLIRMGYIARNPLKKDYWENVDKGIKSCKSGWSQYEVYDEDTSWTASGFSIVGMSGIGKSRSVLRLLSLYPQVIHHSQYNDSKFTLSQLTWLKLECPFDGNPRGLCTSFFKSIDAILGTNYTKQYVKSHCLIDDLVAAMATVAANHFIGVLVIDEVQRLSLAKSGGADKMLNFFVNLINTIGVPIVLIGTYKAMSVLSGEFSQMRRGTGQGDLIWDRMNNDEQWTLFVESLWRYQYTKKETKLTKELADTLYEESQGITDFAVKIYGFAQERAIDCGREKITAAIIRSAAKDKLSIPRDILNALKLGDKSILSLFEDVFPVALKEYIAEVPPHSQITGKMSQEVVINDIDGADTAITSNEDNTPQNANSNKETHIHKNASGNVYNFPNIKKKTNSKQKREERRQLSKTAILPNLFIRLSSTDDLNVYEMLKLNGFIKHSNEFF